MTPNEYRKKHKRCSTCEYLCVQRQPESDELLFFCLVKRKFALSIGNRVLGGVFCRVYKPKEFIE